jgi:hypothetical protein
MPTRGKFSMTKANIVAALTLGILVLVLAKSQPQPHYVDGHHNPESVFNLLQISRDISFPRHEETMEEIRAHFDEFKDMDTNSNLKLSKVILSNLKKGVTLHLIIRKNF